MDIKTMDVIAKAIEFAAMAHEGQQRKSNGIPYITHPYIVGTLLQDAGCSTDVIVSGYLHDVLEDTDASEEEIERLFGRKVLAIVEGCSEPSKEHPWEYRKQHTLNYLEHDATTEVLQVTCADKLHNLRSMQHTYAEEKEAMWTHFSRGKEDQKRLYHAYLRILGERIRDFSLSVLLEAEVRKMFS